MVGPVLPQAGRREQQLRRYSHELPGEPRDSKDAAQGYSEEAVQGRPASRIEVSCNCNVSLLPSSSLHRFNISPFLWDGNHGNHGMITRMENALGNFSVEWLAGDRHTRSRKAASRSSSNGIGSIRKLCVTRGINFRAGSDCSRSSRDCKKPPLGAYIPSHWDFRKTFYRKCPSLRV